MNDGNTNVLSSTHSWSPQNPKTLSCFCATTCATFVPRWITTRPSRARERAESFFTDAPKSLWQYAIGAQNPVEEFCASMPSAEK